MPTSGTMVLATPWLLMEGLGRIGIAAEGRRSGALGGLMAQRVADDRYVDEVWVGLERDRRAAGGSQRGGGRCAGARPPLVPACHPAKDSLALRVHLAQQGR